MWKPERWNEPGRNPWIVKNGTKVYGIGEWIISIEDEDEAARVADILNEMNAESEMDMKAALALEIRR